jgi:hypothetical protein
MSPDLMNEAGRRLDLAVAARDVATDNCYSLATLSFDETCLAKEAVAALDATSTQDQYTAYAQQRVQCDNRGQKNDASCYGQRSDAAAIAARVGSSAFSQQQELSAAGSRSGGNSGGNTGIIVGAVVGGIIAIAVVAFFVTRRNNGPAAAKQQDRSVVAFNNPLYVLRTTYWRCHVSLRNVS